MIPVRRKIFKTPKIQRISVRSWEAGTVTAFDDRRTPLKGLRHSENLILEQNGVIMPRPGTVTYGPPLLGKILGENFEFRAMSPTGPINWLINLQNVDGVTNAYVAKGEDATWTKIEGKTYDNEAPGHFLQVANKVLVMNGKDHLSFLDIPEMKITAFTAIADPVAPTLDVSTGLTGTAFKVFYAVTANSTVGQTKGSPVLTLPIKDDRDMWNPDTQSIKIKWTAVPGAKSYNVFVGVDVDGAGQPNLYQLAAGIPPDTLTFTDNGSRAVDIYSPMPTTNSTAGPRATRGCVSAGRAWLVGDPDNPFHAWRGGGYEHELDFSIANGGGFSVVGSGTKEIPTGIKPYRDGKGDSKVTVLCQGTNGSGKRFTIAPQTVTYGSTSFTIWPAVEDTGADGTDSPDGVIIYNNDLHYPSRDGFKTTGTIPQLQNVLSTRRTSNTIQGDISTLETSSMDKAVGVPYEGRLYWSVPVGSSRNNQIWVLDTDRKGAWMKPWSVAADWLTLYNDNSGRTHFLASRDDRIIEFSKSAKTTDDGVAFPTSATSGQVNFSEDGREWARLLRVIFVVMRPQGRINFSVSGRTEDGVQSYNRSVVFGANSSRSGWSEPEAGWSTRGWSEIRAIPEEFNSASEEIELEIDEDMQWGQYGFSSVDGGVDYSISDVLFEYVNIGIKDLS